MRPEAIARVRPVIDGLAALIILLALIVAVAHFAHRSDAGVARFTHAPSSSSSQRTYSHCDFDGNPNNDKPGECPPWHGN